MGDTPPYGYDLYCPEWRCKPTHRAETYNKFDALSLALICALTYECNETGATNHTLIDAQMAQWGFENCEHFEAAHTWDIDTQGFVASSADRVIVAFRGTDSKQDWRANLQFSKDPGPFDNSYVHKGMQDAFFHVAFDIGRLIERHYHPSKELWVTGHSLGGALAMLLVANLVHRGIYVDGLYSFAAPRVGDELFSQLLEEQFEGVHCRVVNEHDLVPYLPLEVSFSHTGLLVILREHEETLIDVEPNLWTDLKQNLTSWLTKDSGGVENYHRMWPENGYLFQLASDVAINTVSTRPQIGVQTFNKS